VTNIFVHAASKEQNAGLPSKHQTRKEKEIKVRYETALHIDNVVIAFMKNA
jgi:hypothetical protein